MNNFNVKRCSRCVMDESVEDILFDNDGVCNYCKEFLMRSSNVLNIDTSSLDVKRKDFINRVKATSKGKKYDCIIGVSGGVDSSFALVKAVESGLRPLAVHMDNGWNSELAQNNIHNLVDKLGVDLYTHVIDWPEYRKLMEAFFTADVIDVELLYDNAMLAVNYNLAKKFGVKFILAGTNMSTEGMLIPRSWNWFKFDKRNILSIAKKSSINKFVTFPAMGVFDYIINRYVRKINWISFLDYFDYKKDDALNVLVRDFSYKPYPYKHYESVFTRFYQGYILPQKFNVDKRLVHFSTLIMTGQLDREVALSKLNELPYPSLADLEKDKSYFLKKMGWTTLELDSYLSRPRVEHSFYGSELSVMRSLQNVKKRLIRS